MNQVPNKHIPNKRINHLDGLRGLAILLVLGFHAFSRYPNIVPYGNKYADFPLFSMGWLGVQLFFLISGFVILMTLDKCENSRQFLYRRWLRLFPAMLISSALIFFTLPVFFERPGGDESWLNLLPGLTFIEQSWWSALLGVTVHPIEGAFWSLFVEFKFYVVAALLYFSVGRKKLIYCLLLLYVISWVLKLMVGWSDLKVIYYLNEISKGLSFSHFGWFAAGASFYVFHETKNKNWFHLGLLTSLVCSFLVRGFYWKLGLVAFLISSVFAVALFDNKLRSILESKVLLLLGFVSYPLYLIHEGIMISLIVKLEHAYPNVPGYLYPVIPVCLLVGASYLIVKYGEKPLRKLIVMLLSFVRKSI